jgi:hypothetical protein
MLWNRFVRAETEDDHRLLLQVVWLLFWVCCWRRILARWLAPAVTSDLISAPPSWQRSRLGRRLPAVGGRGSLVPSVMNMAGACQSLKPWRTKAAACGGNVLELMPCQVGAAPVIRCRRLGPTHEWLRRPGAGLPRTKPQPATDWASWTRHESHTATSPISVLLQRA